MILFYRIFIHLYGLILTCIAPFNKKAARFIRGRKEQADALNALSAIEENRVWFHFPSLGEFEQGRPVLERWKESNPDDKIVMTFFSPSGYEIRKNYALADYVFYLPLDSAQRSMRFIKQVKPRLVVFTKYDFWYYYFTILHKLDIPLYVISAIFRADQIYFRWYGSFFRKILRSVRVFFVQDELSVGLLNSVGIKDAIRAGDTRFDRVIENAALRKRLPEIEGFCKESPVFIAGSTWPADEKALLSLILDASAQSWKFIIAPHEPGPSMKELLETVPNAILYSKWKLMDQQTGKEENFRLLIIDNIGMLSNLYQYGRIAYIGGGFGKGIHNILEAGVFSLPLIFGPVYGKFKEAKDLVQLGAAFPIENQSGLIPVFKRLSDESFRVSSGKISSEYIRKQSGASDLILSGLGEPEKKNHDS